MILLLMVIVLLALAWGLSDYQLGAPVEQAPPPPIVAKPQAPAPPTESPAPAPAADVASQQNGTNPPPAEISAARVPDPPPY